MCGSIIAPVVGAATSALMGGGGGGGSAPAPQGPPPLPPQIQQALWQNLLPWMQQQQPNQFGQQLQPSIFGNLQMGLQQQPVMGLNLPQFQPTALQSTQAIGTQPINIPNVQAGQQFLGGVLGGQNQLQLQGNPLLQGVQQELLQRQASGQFGLDPAVVDQIRQAGLGQLSEQARQSTMNVINEQNRLGMLSSSGTADRLAGVERGRLEGVTQLETQIATQDMQQQLQGRLADLSLASQQGLQAEQLAFEVGRFNMGSQLGIAQQLQQYDVALQESYSNISYGELVRQAESGDKEALINLQSRVEYENLDVQEQRRVIDQFNQNRAVNFQQTMQAAQFYDAMDARQQNFALQTLMGALSAYSGQSVAAAQNSLTSWMKSEEFARQDDKTQTEQITSVFEAIRGWEKKRSDAQKDRTGGSTPNPITGGTPERRGPLPIPESIGGTP